MLPNAASLRCGIGDDEHPPLTRVASIAMTHQPRSIIVSIASIACTALLAACNSTPAPTALSDEEIGARMMQAATPGEMHAFLAYDTGRWTGTSKSWPGIGAEPITMPAEFTVRMVLGGRFSETTYSADMPGVGKFEGIAITGYDNAAGEYQCTWIDSFGTTMMIGTGKRLADGKSVETNFTYFCPVRNRRVPVRQLITHDSEDRQTHRMWANDMATNAEYLMMEAAYTRVK